MNHAKLLLCFARARQRRDATKGRPRHTVAPCAKERLFFDNNDVLPFYARNRNKA
jgi:hypothetical protein